MKINALQNRHNFVMDSETCDTGTVSALDLGSSAERLAGSSPARRTPCFAVVCIAPDFPPSSDGSLATIADDSRGPRRDRCRSVATGGSGDARSRRFATVGPD